MRKALTVMLLTMLVAPAAADAQMAPGQASAAAIRAASAMGQVEGAPAVSETSLLAAESAVMGVTSMPPGPVAAGLTGAPGERAVLHGRFTDTRAAVPRGAHAPTGTVLELALDSSGDVVAEHLSEPGGGTASAARANAARRRPKAHASVTSTWPCKDEAESGYTGAGHCYATAEWFMGSATEKVAGSEAQIETTEMWVPEPGQGAFVDNEEWVVFPERHNNLGSWWIEAGQQAGDNQPDVNRAMDWFWAYNNASGFHYGNPGWPEEGWVFHNYSMQSRLNSEWCVWIDGGSAGCVGGLLAYSKELQVGGEYATPWQPANNMYDQVNYTPARGGGTRTWKEAEWFRSPTTCITGFSRENPPHYYAGNIRSWVPC